MLHGAGNGGPTTKRDNTPDQDTTLPPYSPAHRQIAPGLPQLDQRDAIGGNSQSRYLIVNSFFIVLVSYDSMRRRSKLITFHFEDIEWLADEGASILLCESKTDQHGGGKWVHLAAETTSALKAWICAAQIDEGFIFRGFRPSDMITRSLRERRISRIYKSLARKAGLSEPMVKAISGHSARVGRAQDLL